MDLENLKFKVDSKEVLSAFEDLGRLRTQIEALAKPLENLAKATAKVDKALGESADSAKEVQVKTEQLARANQDATEGTNELSNATDKLDKKRKNSIDLLEKENNKLKLIRKERIETVDGIFAMAESLTASQANNLASLATKGASTQYLNLLSDVYNNINKVLGANPFDQSTDGVAKLKRELSDLNKVEEYARQGYNLTGKQLGYLSTSLEKIEQSYKAMGKSEADILQAQKAMESEFVTHLGQLQDKQKVSYQMNQQSKETTRALEKETRATAEYNKQLVLFNEYKDAGFSDEIAKKATQMRMKGINADAVYDYAGNALQEEYIKAEKEKAVLQEKSHQQASMMMQQATEQFRANNLKKEESQRKVNEQLAIEAKALEFQAQGYQRGESVRGARSILTLGVDENTVKATLQQTRASREAIQNDKELAKSRAYLAEETARVENAINRMSESTHLNNRISEEMSANMDKYSKHLTRVGITGEEATKKLDKYHKSLQTINEQEVQNKVNYLSRSLAPQISDVAVSLYGGMSPMTVLMQQGLQVRDMIGQVGLQADQTNQAMKKAGAEFVGSIGSTMKAMGNLVFGVFQNMSNGFVNFTNNFNPIAKGMDAYTYSLISAGKEQTLMFKSLQVFSTWFRNGLAVTLALVTSALVFYAYQVYDASKAHDALVKGIAETGGALGLTASSIEASSKALANAEVTARDLSDAFMEIGKDAILAGQDIGAIALASARYADASGKSVGEVIKQYKEIPKDPVKALQELGARTGDVTLATIEHTRKLVDQGREFEAVESASLAMTSSFNQSTKEINDNLSSTGKFLKLVGDTWDTYWAKAKGIGGGESTQDKIAVLEETKKRGGLPARMGDKNYAGNLGEIDKDIAKLKALIKVEEEKLALEQRNSVLAKQSQEIDAINEKVTSKKEKISKEIAKAQGSINVETAKGINANNLYIEAKKKLIAFNEVELKQIAEQEAEDAKRKAKQEAGPKPKKEGKSEAERYRDKVDTESTRVIDNLRKAYEGLYAKEYELLPIERELNKIRTDPQYKDYNAQDKKAIDNLGRKALVQAILNELDKDAEKVKKQINDQEEKRIELSSKALESAQDSLTKYNESLQQEAETIQFEISLLGKSAEEQTRLTNIRNEYVKSTAVLLALEKQRANVQPQDQAKFEALIAEASARVNESSARGNAKTDLEKQKKAFDELKAKQEEFTNGFADAMATAILEGGSAGATKLKDLMKQMFIREPIKVLLKGVMDSMFGSGGALGSLGSLGSIGSSLSNLFKGGSSIFDSLKSLFSGSASVPSYKAVSGLAVGGDRGGSALAPVNPFLRTAGNALQGYAIGSTLNAGLSNGFGLSKGVTNVQNLGSAIAGALLGPIGGFIGGAGSALFNQMFGRKQVGNGFMGSFSGGNVTSSSYSEKQGGWFRSNKIDKTTLTGKEADLWNSNFKSMQQGAINMARALGLGGESLKQFSGDVKINLKGLSAEEATKKIQEEFNNVQRTMLETLPAFKDFEYAGETAGKAFDKLMTDVRNSLDAVGITTESLGQIILQNMTGQISAEEAGKALSESVIGGIYDSIAGSYAQGIAQAFMTQIVQPVMAAILAGVPISQAISQEAISVVVAQAQASAQALSAILNNPDFVKAMNGIQQAIGGIVGASTGVAGNSMASEKRKQERSNIEYRILELQKNTTELRKRELKTIDPMNRALQTRLWKLEDEEKIKNERLGLENSLLQLQGNTVELRSRELKTLDPANRALQEQIWALEDLKKINEEKYGLESKLLELQGNTVELRNRELLNLNPVNRALQQQIWALEDLKKINDEKYGLETKLLELQENTTELRRRELLTLDPTNRALQEYIWALEDQKKKAEELKGAWQSVTDALSSEIKRIKDEVLGLSDNPTNNIQRQFDEMTARARRGDVGAGERLPELSNLLLEERRNSSTTLAQFMLAQAQIMASLDVTRKLLKTKYGVDIPAYASGGNHSGGLAVVGENGAELVNLPPSTIHTNSNSRNMLSEANRELVQELISLRSEVTYLRAEVRAGVVTSSKTTKILERVTRNDDVVYTSTEV